MGPTREAAPPAAAQASPAQPAGPAGESPPAGSGIRPEPRWAAILAVLAVGGLQLALPRSLTVGPEWLPLAIVAGLMGPTIVFRRRGYYRANQFLGSLISMVLTVALVAGVIALVAALPRHLESPVALMRSGAIRWVTNVVVFATWYWRLDAGGPNARDRRGAHTDGAFLFPQMTIRPPVHTWRPGFVDYLFLSFTTCTAFSPTDTPVLSRWAKLMMMLQAITSFVIAAVLLARSVNIL